VTRALVTGGAGFIGSNLVRGLLQRRWTVRVLDNFSTGHRSNLDPVASDIELIEGSICDAEACLSAARECDVVFHLAADVSVPRSMRNPESTHRTNVDGLYNCLIAAREAGVGRFVFASSSAVYGEAANPPVCEDQPFKPISPYGASKAIGELYCETFARSFGIETVCLRYFNVFGPNQDPNSQYAAAIPAFVSRMLKGQPPVIFGDGEQSRDFTFIDNVIEANLCAAEADIKAPVTVNIACGKPASVNEIVAQLNKALVTSIEPRYDKPRPGDIRHSWADISAAEQLIGYRPTTGLEDGLSQAVQWYKENL